MQGRAKGNGMGAGKGTEMGMMMRMVQGWVCVGGGVGALRYGESMQSCGVVIVTSS